MCYLLHLCQVYINIITGVVGVPLLLVLFYFLLQKVQNLEVVGMDSLVRSWQVLHQAGEDIIQLLTASFQIKNRAAVYFVMTA